MEEVSVYIGFIRFSTRTEKRRARYRDRNRSFLIFLRLAAASWLLPMTIATFGHEHISPQSAQVEYPIPDAHFLMGQRESQ